MSVFAVRGAIEADIPTVKRIADVCFTDPWGESTFRSMLSSTVFCVATYDGEMIGYAVAAVTGDEAELYDIAVLPAYRGTGMASELYDTVASKVKEGGAVSFYLEVREGNLRAQAFYAKKGFVKSGMRRNYYDDPKENAILMSLDLKA